MMVNTLRKAWLLQLCPSALLTMLHPVPLSDSLLTVSAYQQQTTPVAGPIDVGSDALVTQSQDAAVHRDLSDITAASDSSAIQTVSETKTLTAARTESTSQGQAVAQAESKSESLISADGVATALLPDAVTTDMEAAPDEGAPDVATATSAVSNQISTPAVANVVTTSSDATPQDQVTESVQGLGSTVDTGVTVDAGPDAYGLNSAASQSSQGPVETKSSDVVGLAGNNDVTVSAIPEVTAAAGAQNQPVVEPTSAGASNVNGAQGSAQSQTTAAADQSQTPPGVVVTTSESAGQDSGLRGNTGYNAADSAASTDLELGSESSINGASSAIQTESVPESRSSSTNTDHTDNIQNEGTQSHTATSYETQSQSHHSRDGDSDRPTTKHSAKSNRRASHLRRETRVKLPSDAGL